MRVRTNTFITVTMLAATAALATAGGAFADAGSGDTSSKPAVETSSKPPVETSSKPPVDTAAPPRTDVPKPATIVPVAKPVTTTPATTTAVATTPVEKPTAQNPTEPKAPVVPQECVEADAAALCVRDTPTAVPSSASTTPGSGAQLPFTGPGDVVLAIVIALIAGTGGILFLFGAAGREQLDVLNRRGMDSPSGFQLAYRELRKEQVER